jgi:hypothetical protein
VACRSCASVGRAPNALVKRRTKTHKDTDNFLCHGINRLNTT